MRRKKKRPPGHTKKHGGQGGVLPARHEQTTTNPLGDRGHSRGQGPSTTCALPRGKGTGWRWALVVLVVSLVTRLAWLGWPPVPMADEGPFFGAQINAYLETGEWGLINMHPPHAQLLEAGVVSLLGYHGGQYFPTALDVLFSLPDEMRNPPLVALSPWTMRLLPALAGVLLPLLLFAILRHVGVREQAAGVCALAVALDNATIVQSRMLGRYPLMLAALLAAVWWALKATSGGITAGTRLILVTACGLALGFAVGCHWTALTGVALVGVILLAPVRPSFGGSGLCPRIPGNGEGVDGKHFYGR